LPKLRMFTSWIIWSNSDLFLVCAYSGTTLTRVEVERYDPYHNTWTATCPAVKYVTNFTCTACQGKLYVIGSCAVKYNPLTMQCYNPVIDSWMSICSPFIPKYLSSPRSVCMEGNIYLLADNTKKVYSYDPDANMWQKVPAHEQT
ncbi:kelch-like protein 30, partial [Hippocampus comes]|uniref:kelch-like protein 30 n=1 Tax=Hippocampus comes TaxID=109280 RepID=UPI00094E1B22